MSKIVYSQSNKSLFIISLDGVRITCVHSRPLLFTSGIRNIAKLLVTAPAVSRAPTVERLLKLHPSPLRLIELRWPSTAEAATRDPVRSWHDLGSDCSEFLECQGYEAIEAAGVSAFCLGRFRNTPRLDRPALNWSGGLNLTKPVAPSLLLPWHLSRRKPATAAKNSELHQVAM